MNIPPVYRFPPDDYLGAIGRFGRLPIVFSILAIAAASFDLLLFGWPDTPIPYNYPFVLDIVFVCAASVLLSVSHIVLWDIAEEVVTIIEYNQDDPLSIARTLDPDVSWTELDNILYISYHPGVILLGGLSGGVFVTGVMAILGVFDAYPYILMNFAFGAAHGIFIGPVLGGVYFIERIYNNYMIDITLLDPDGVGGYRQIGNGLAKLTTYGIFFVTFDFLILSSVGFTQYSRFQIVVSAIYLLQILLFVGGVTVTTLLIRRKLIDIRDEKLAAMQQLFVVAENRFWWKLNRGQDNFVEAMNILSISAIFDNMNNMNMWPMNLLSLTRLLISVGASLVVYYYEIGVDIEELSFKAVGL